jgi:hypothetical protein
MRRLESQSLAGAVRAMAVVVPLLGAGGAAGCAARTTQFHDFATAGVTYVKASDAVLEEAGTAAIGADSGILISARANTPVGERTARLLAANKLLKDRVAILRDIRRHGRVLQRYFEALASIADSKAPESAAKAAESAFGALAGLSASIKASPLAPVVPGLTKLIVGSFKVRILEDELHQRADAVAAELALQEAAFAKVGELLQTDLRVQLNTLESRQVVQPFAADAVLPKEWAQNREQVITASAASAAASAGARAAGALRQAFEAVVANRFDRAAFTSLLDDIGEMLTIAEQLAPAAREGE